MNLRLQAIVTYLPPVVLLGSVILVSRLYGVSDVMLRSDPSTATGSPFYLGFVSNIGILIWCACAATCLYSWFLIRNFESGPDRLLLGAGLVTAWLLFDDVFLLHEVVLPYFGVPERAVVGIYAIAVPCFLLANVRLILKTDYVLLLSALFFLGLSVIVDELSFFYVYLPRLVQGWLEDGAKLLGICGWFSYWVVTSARSVRLVFRGKTGASVTAASLRSF